MERHCLAVIAGAAAARGERDAVARAGRRNPDDVRLIAGLHENVGGLAGQLSRLMPLGVV